MSNPLGQQDLVGNRLTCENLLNKATLSNPAAVGTGLAATYIPLSVAFTSTAVSNVYQMPYAESLILLVSLVSGSASSVSVNAGSLATNCVAVSNTGVITDTNLHAVFVSMPSAALGSTTPQPGMPTASFISVSINTAGCQINQLALFPMELLPFGADWFSIRGGGSNATASGVNNFQDTVSPAYLVGAGNFVIDSSV